MDSQVDLGEASVALPTVGTNLTDLILQKRKITVRELGGFCGGLCQHCPDLVVVRPAAVCSLCGAAALCCCTHTLQQEDLPCTMSLVELKALFRMDDIIRAASQSISTLEISARSGQGLQELLSWPFSNHSHDTG